MEFYIINFSDKKVPIDKDDIIKIPYFKNIIDSGLNESITKEFKLLEYKYESFINIHCYLISDKIYKNSLNKEEINLCDYLNYDEYIEKSCLECSKSYLIDNNIYTCDEIILNDFVNYDDKLIFDDEKDFDKYLDNLDAFDLEKKGKHGFIHILSWYNKRYMINFESILDKIDVNLQTIAGVSALIFASCYSNTTSSENIVKMLLEHPNINVNLQNNKNASSLVIASRYSRTTSTDNTVKMLLEHPNIDVNLRDNVDWTALMTASRYSKTTSTDNTVKMLLKHPNINVNLQSKFGWTALMFASRYSNNNSSENTVKMLLEHPDINIKLQNSNGDTALMLALRYSNSYSSENTVKMILEHPDINS